ncbi:MAG TPA: hypothetical protein VII27_04655 [Thermoplasmata archaeon]
MTILIRVDNGTSVTVWERTTTTNPYAFSVTTLTGPGATFDTLAFEHYTVTSDGAYLKIHCFRPTFSNGTGTGDNIAGVRLDGVPGFPGGIWASTIESYVVGYGGIASSRFDALGPNLATITFMGDQDSELVLGFTAEAPEYSVTVDTVPAGLEVSVDGTTATAPVTFTCVTGSRHTIAAPSPQGAGDTRFVFVNWSDGGGPSHDVTCLGAANYTAFFATQLRVVLQTEPAGLGLFVDSRGYDAPYADWWNASEPHVIDAPSPQYTGPETRWAWQSWSDGGAQTRVVGVTAPTTLTARFRAEVRVTVTTSPEGLTVAADGTDWVGPQTYWWTVGSSHTLDAPDRQEHGGSVYRLESWSDTGAREHAVTVDGPATYTAVYREVPPPISMNWKPLVAAAFSCTLLLVGLYRSGRRPYRFREPLRRSLKTFLVLSLPFVAAEAGTGVLSLAFGVLAIPPLLGWGTAVDLAILVVGIVAVLVPRGVAGLIARVPART